MERKGFIGGSDAVKIMNGDWLELWQIKTGVKEPDDLSSNLAVQLGSYTEDFNLSWFEKENNCVLSNHQSEFEISSGRIVPFVVLSMPCGMVRLLRPSIPIHSSTWIRCLRYTCRSYSFTCM